MLYSRHKMNIRIFSDRATTITANFYFFKEQKWWKKKLRYTDVVSTEERTDGVVFTVVGRTSQEVGQIDLEYDGQKVTLYPDAKGEYDDIVIYDGDRDYWTNVLRRKALNQKKGNGKK